MSFIPEESKEERELRKKVEDAFADDPSLPGLHSREQKRKKKEEARERDYEQKQKTLEYKRARLEWQKERSKIKDLERAEAEKRRQSKVSQGTSSNINIEPISDKDRDPTAYSKAIKNVASFGGALVGTGTRAVIDAARRRKQLKQKKAQIAAQKASQEQREKTQSAMAQSKNRLLPGYLPNETPGQRARRDPSFRKRETESRGGTTEEGFSCWREDFLYEIKDFRKKAKKRDDEDYIVDVMKGKNNVTIGPDIKAHNIEEKVNLSRIKKGVKKLVQKVEVPLFATAFALGALQSPENFVSSGKVEGPGVQLMSKMMKRRKEADRNLDSGRVSHPARNIKINEELSKENLLKLIVKKLVDEKKRKNSLIINKYIGEENDKSDMKCNKPQRAPKGAKQKYIVNACDNGENKIVRFGFRGMQDFLQHKDEERRKNFKARHRCAEKKDKLTPGWWACNYNW